MGNNVVRGAAHGACWSAMWYACFSACDGALNAVGCPPLCSNIGAAAIAGGTMGGLQAARQPRVTYDERSAPMMAGSKNL